MTDFEVLEAPAVPPGPKPRKWPQIEMELYDRDGASMFSFDAREMQGLTYSTAAGLGFSTAAFVVKRDPRLYYPDLELCNIFRVLAGDVAWEGEIFSSGLDITADIQLPIECDGWAYRLGSRRAEDALGAEKGSAWMTDHMIADEDLGLKVGEIDTEDYEFPYGIAGVVGKPWIDALSSINRANNYEVAVWEGKKFYFRKKDTSPAYIVRVEESQVNLARSLEQIENYLYVTYTDNLGASHNFWWPSTGPDEDSEKLYRRRDGELEIPGESSEAQAQVMAQVVLDERKKLRPATSLTVTKVWDASTGTEVNPALVRAEKPVFVENLYPSATTINEKAMVNELSTFEIVETTYDVTGSLTISPGRLGQMMEKMMAQIEAKTKT